MIWWENNKINLNYEEECELKKCKTPEEELELLFKFIKKREWIKYERNQNNKSDGLLGNIFEDLIGLKENNYKIADYNGIEIKTQNKSSKSAVSLFGYTLPNLNSEILERFGVYEDDKNNKKFYSTIKSEIWNTHRGGYSFKLDKQEDKVYLRIKETINDNIIDDNKFSWDINKIEKLFFSKIKKCCMVVGELDKKNKLVKYNQMTIYSSPDIKMFWKLFNEQKIVIDFRIGVYKSGKNIGKTHDHGTGFRILNKDDFVVLYKKNKIIK